MYIYIYICICIHITRIALPSGDVVSPLPWFVLYTILFLPILYGVHTNGRSEGESYTVQSSFNRIAPGWAMQVGGENERMVDLCSTASK